RLAAGAAGRNREPAGGSPRRSVGAATACVQGIKDSPLDGSQRAVPLHNAVLRRSICPGCICRHAVLGTLLSATRYECPVYQSSKHISPLLHKRLPWSVAWLANARLLLPRGRVIDVLVAEVVLTAERPRALLSQKWHEGALRNASRHRLAAAVFNHLTSERRTTCPETDQQPCVRTWLRQQAPCPVLSCSPLHSQ